MPLPSEVLPMLSLKGSACARCGRPRYLWGGKSCDACDRDNNGTQDAVEPVGIGPSPKATLFPVEEKGFVLLPGGKQKSGVPHEIRDRPARPDQLSRVRQILRRRAA